jgi:hypothetical protein
MNLKMKNKLCAIITVDGAWMDNPEKNSQSNSSHSCGSYEQHSENSRFYRTLDY